MTSKNLFFKLIWQDFKKRIWCPIIIFLVYFVATEIPLLKMLDWIKQYPNESLYGLKHYFANDFLSPNENCILLYLTVVVAAICAFCGYAYLHSRKQLDTYHSMPVKREVLFFTKYVSGTLMFAVPFAIHILLALLIACTKDAFSFHGMVNAIAFYGIQLLVFLLIYSFCIVVMCLTGNMIISILGSCVLVGYSTILAELNKILCDTFFHTYMISYEQGGWKISPFDMVLSVYETAKEYREWNTGFSYRCMVSDSVAIILAILVFTVAGVLVYRKRATEAAGKPIAFSITEPFIKAMVVLPFSLLCGFIICEMANSHSFGWRIFGISFSFFVIALLMEAIFRLDIRCLFCHWKQLIFNGVCLLLIVIVFKYDVLGYDTYLPNEQELNSCAVSIRGLFYVNSEKRTTRYGYVYTDSMDYSFDTMNILNNPSTMKLAKKAASEGLNIAEDESYEGMEDYRSVCFKFTTKKGKDIYRQYYIDITDEETIALLENIFDDANYKLGSWPLLADGWRKEYVSIDCRSNAFSRTVNLSSERQAKLLEVYQKDLLNLTLYDVMNTIPLGNITFNIKGITRNDYGGAENGYKIYPQFTDTIALLKEYGFDYTKEISDVQVNKIVISRYDDNIYEYQDDAEQPVLEYTDEESIHTIMEQAYCEELLYDVQAFYRGMFSDDEIEVYYIEDGFEGSNCYRFKDGQVPEFVEKDFASIF